MAETGLSGLHRPYTVRIQSICHGLRGKSGFQLGICLALLIASSASAEQKVSRVAAMGDPIILPGRGDARNAFSKHPDDLARWHGKMDVAFA